jgi:hypothetical protein
MFEHSQTQALGLNLKIGKCFAFLNDFSNAEKYFDLCLNSESEKGIRDEAVFHMGFLLLKRKRHRQSITFLEKNHPSSENRLVNTLILANMLCLGDPDKAQKLIKSFEDKGHPYLQPFGKYLDILKKIRKKSPLLAGLMSAAVPGSGRIYSGRVKEGLISIASFMATSFLAYEGFKDQGIKSFRGWLFGSVGVLLYIGNIYGSVLSARMTNQKIDDNYQKGIEISLKLYIHE